MRPTVQELETKIKELENTIAAFEKETHVMSENDFSFRKIFENVATGIAITDWDGNFKRCNMAYCDMLGYSMQELEQLTFAELVHPDDREANLSYTEKLKSGEVSSFAIENRYLSKDGHPIWVKKYVSVLPDKTGTPAYMIAQVFDITHDKGFSEKLSTILLEAEELAGLGVWEWDIIENTWTMSDNWFKIYGCPEKVYNTREVLKVVHPDDADLVEQTFKNALQDCKDCRVEHRIIQPNTGDVRYIKALGVLHFDQQGNATKMYGTAQDVTEQRKADENLYSSQERFKSIFQHSNIGIAVGDVNGNMIEVNPELLNILGYSKAELFKMNFVDFTHPDDIESEMIEFEKLRDGLIHDYRITKRYITKSGGIRWVDVAVTCRKNKIGEVSYFVGMVMDVTEKAEAEAALKKSQARLQLALDSAQEGIWEWDLKANKVFFDNGALTMLGYTQETFDTDEQHVLNLIYPHEKKSVLKAANDYVNGKIDNYDVEFQLRQHDGTYKWIWSVGKITAWDEHGKPWLFTGIHRDISERKKAAEKLRKTEERMRLALDSVSDAVWDWRVDTGEVYFSSRWYTMLGYEPYELPQSFETWQKLLHPDDRTISENAVFEHLELAKPFEIEFRMRSKDHAWRWILARGDVVEKDSNGKAVRLLGTHMDITERKRLEKHMRESQKMESIGNLAGGIAHDFNNILYPIIGMAELLIEDLPHNSLEQENAKEIFKAGKRGRDLVRQILAFSRQAEHKLEPVNLQDIAKDVLKLSRATIPVNITIRQDIEPTCGNVLADATQIHQVAMNIMTNAFHAVEAQGGAITVQLRECNLSRDDVQELSLVPGRYALLSVTDTGHGIAPEVMTKIFEPYFSTKDRGKGTGLGLAVAYGIVKEHKGEIAVSSEVGTGTTVDVFLPITDKVAETEHRDAEKLPTGTERVLLVDDEKAIINLEKQMLERLGYRVVSCRNGAEALTLFKAHADEFDLVLSDMAMPNMTGDQLADEIKALKPNMPVIICTGFSEKINKQRAHQAGINGFLLKPIIQSELAQTIRDVLDNVKIT